MREFKTFLFLSILSNLFFSPLSPAATQPTMALSIQELKAKGSKLHQTHVILKGCTKSVAVRMSDNKKDYWYSFYMYPSCNIGEKQFVKVNSYRRSNGKNITAYFSPKINTMQMIRGKYIHGSGKDKELIGAVTAKEQK